MAKTDYYQTLGVDRKADAETIKKAYRKLAMQYHPDRNKDNAAAEHKFKEISEAYDILKDDQKRAAYDQYGHAAFENGGMGAGRGAGGFDFAGGFSDIFNEMFGGDFMGGGRKANQRGADLRYNMQITLEEAFAGKKASIRLTTAVACDSCHGTGGEKGAQPITCSTCRGSGKQRSTQGFFTIERTCHTCNGAGRVIEKPCKSCQGSGRQRKEKTLSVSIPAGVEEGTRIRLSGEGEAGLHGTASGDLYIFITIAPHAFFEREESSIFCKIPIPMTTASLGGTIDVPCIDGTRAKVNIPAGTQTGQKLRLRHKGMSILRSNNRGDMYVEIFVETPINLTKAQQELLKSFEEGSVKSKKNNPQSESFFTKVKEFWQELKE
ncbi:MAG: molecular chaperone DnaJ [Alphaproteobacteria bacterium]|nr:molecular chaperone DnaJ [Alphaproteobacteria bacterium]